jgi:hypothetical protein
MRIAWATPFNRQSTIARDFSLPIACALLERGHGVDIVRTEVHRAVALPALEILAPIHPPLGFAGRVSLDVFDAVVINWADDFQLHGGALALTPQVPTVAILHAGDMRRFAAAAVKLYGMAAGHFVRPFPAAPPRSEPTAERDGVLAWFASLAAGAVVHEAEWLAPVAAACPGPVRFIAATGSGKTYVDELEPLLDAAIVARPLVEAGFQFGAMFEACGARPDEPAIGRVAAVMAELFARHDREDRPA